MTQFFLVLTGGAIGSVGRWLTGRGMLAMFGPAYPYGTLAVNLVGGLLMGVLVATLARLAMPVDNIRLFFATGVLGGFTTFSAFSLDVVTLIERRQTGLAAAYVGVSVVCAIAALFLGLIIARRAFGVPA